MINTLAKYISELATEEFDNADKVAALEGILEDMEDEDPKELLLFGRLLSEMGKVVEKRAFDDVLEIVKKEGNFDYFGSKVSLMTTDQWDFLDDPIYKKYEAMEEKKKEELKDIRSSLKTRKENLIEENKALKLKPRETLRIKL